MTADRAPFFLTGSPVTIVIDEGPYQGAEVDVLTDVPLGVPGVVGQALAAGKIRTAWVLFAENVLIGWNLHDRHGSVPPDGAAFERVTTPLLTRVMELWADLMLKPDEETEDGE